MNRANFGNQITNGMQILSVAGTTTAGFINSSRQRKINDLSSGLNNLSEDELRQYGQMRADKMRDQIHDYYGSENGTLGKAPNEGFSQKTSSPIDKDNTKNYYFEPDTTNDTEKGLSNVVDVDYDIINDLSSAGFEENSEQFSMLNMKVGRDTKWLDKFTSNNLPSRRFQ